MGCAEPVAGAAPATSFARTVIELGELSGRGSRGWKTQQRTLRTGNRGIETSERDTPANTTNPNISRVPGHAVAFRSSPGQGFRFPARTRAAVVEMHRVFGVSTSLWCLRQSFPAAGFSGGGGNTATTPSEHQQTSWIVLSLGVPCPRTAEPVFSFSSFLEGGPHPLASRLHPCAHIDDTDSTHNSNSRDVREPTKRPISEPRVGVTGRARGARAQFRSRVSLAVPRPPACPCLLATRCSLLARLPRMRAATSPRRAKLGEDKSWGPRQVGRARRLPGVLNQGRRARGLRPKAAGESIAGRGLPPAPGGRPKARGAPGKVVRAGDGATPVVGTVACGSGPRPLS